MTKYRSLIDFPNYLVYEDGSIFSVRAQRFLNGGISGKGYLSVDLRYNGFRKRIYIHRLVATLFLKNPKNKKEINHKNGDKKDNRKSNLEWVTRGENLKHAAKNFGHYRNERSGACKFSDELVRQIRKEYKEKSTTQAELSRKYGVSAMQVCRIVNNKLRIL